MSKIAEYFTTVVGLQGVSYDVHAVGEFDEHSYLYVSKTDGKRCRWIKYDSFRGNFRQLKKFKTKKLARRPRGC